MKRILIIVILLTQVCLPIMAAEEIELISKTITINNSQIEISIINIPVGMKLQTGIALGDGKVGGVEELAEMAKRRGAFLAVNGTFFNPEDYNNANPTEPYGTLINKGRVIHVGNYGATVVFNKDGDILIKQLRIKIEGGSNGLYQWPHNWYAYGINHTPGGPAASSVYIYTPERGENVGFSYGTKVVVSNGRVVKIEKNRDVLIPADGYVIVMTGAERQLERVFKVGKKVDYRIKFEDINQREVTFNYYTAVGAGPMLVKGGKILTNYREQGFNSQKILKLKGRRTALGIKRDGSIVIVLARRASIKEMANVMKYLKTVNALNLDGGASSGLWYDGDYVVQPGRDLSNSLLFLE